MNTRGFLCLEKRFSFVLGIIIIILCSSNVRVSGDEPVWNQDIIDAAVEADLVNYTQAIDLGNGILYRSQAMYFLALASYYDSNLTASDGTLVSDRLLEQIRQMISSGNEPGCRGAVMGWCDNAAAQSLVLAKRTPTIWSQLTSTEKEKCNLLMRCLTIAGNYCQNRSSNPHVDLDQSYECIKTWNPNLQEGYVGIMAASYLYFGGLVNVDGFLANFDHDTYMSDLLSYGFTNILATFFHAGKSLMENGGFDAEGGLVASVRTKFRFKDLLTGSFVDYKPFLLFRSLSTKMYHHTCASTVYNGEGYIIDGTTSPYDGLPGMCYEFMSGDGKGDRTSATYVYQGWRNSVITRATLHATDFWPGIYEDDVTIPMHYGSEDFLYKLDHGYQGWSHGGYESPAYEFDRFGYVFTREVWTKLIAPHLVEVIPEADTYISPVDYADNNYGASGTIAIKDAPGVIKYDRIGMLKFNLSNLSGTIKAARLRMYCTSSTSSSISVYSGPDSWTENVVTYNNAPGQSSKILTQDVNGPGWQIFDVTDYVKTEFEGDGVASFWLADAEIANVLMTFNSKESTDNKIPVLEVIFENKFAK